MASSIRSITEIVNRILETVYDHDGDNHDGEGITQTEIMLEVYLSGGSLREYLIALTVHGLLIYDSAMRTYHITERGIRFLELYSNLGDMMT
ncbi:MAG TPA: winged helix-turn-helix domain-containing protein [Nitrososphaera sp.]|nr:winged helix-turn-helix domain-containing protein [Nitrososphaera sp.]